MNLSVVIPVYNSELSLRPLVERLQPVLGEIANQYELILVNDGSSDNSWDIVCELASEHDWIRGINLMRNYGQHNAVLCGIRAAQFEVTVTMDDDLQHPPEEIPKLLGKFHEDCDVVYGTPRKERHGLLRNLASVLTKMALKGAMGLDVARNVSAFRVFHTHLRQAFSDYSGSFVSIDVLLTWGATRFAAIPVQHEPRTLGVSNYTFRKLLTHAFNMMTGFSAWPLQLASVVGFAFTLLGLGVLVYVVGRFLIEGGSVPGFPFLASIIAIFSGAQLFALGIMGEYLARIHFRAIEKPPYAIRTCCEERKAIDDPDTEET